MLLAPEDIEIMHMIEMRTWTRELQRLLIEPQSSMNDGTSWFGKEVVVDVVQFLLACGRARLNTLLASPIHQLTIRRQLHHLWNIAFFACL